MPGDQVGAEESGPRLPPKLRIETLKAGGVLICLLVYLVLVGGLAVTAVLGPFLHASESITYSLPSTSESEISWNGTVSGLSRWNRGFALFGVPTSAFYETAGFQKSVDVLISLYGSSDDGASWSTIISESSRQFVLDCKYQTTTCNKFQLLDVQSLEYSEYLVVLDMDNVNADEDFVSEIVFEFMYTTYTATLIELIIRYTCLGLSLAAIVFFLICMKPLSKQDWIPEQRWIAVLAVATIGFNNPAFLCDLYTSLWFFPMISELLQLSFICCLMLAWLLVMDSVLEDESKRSFFSFYFFKLVLTTLMWGAVMTLSVVNNMSRHIDPSHLSASDNPYFRGVAVGIAVVAVLYIIWVLYLCLRIVGELRNIPRTPTGFKLLCFLTMFTLLFTMVGVVLNSFSLLDSSVRPLAWFTLLNFYVYTLLYLFSPKFSSASDNQRLFSGPSSAPEKV